jgi:predicted membrane-bound spermidine synthase
MIAALGLIGFASGAAALVFEALWFYTIGLSFGNSVWATSLVTASFMAGLALGSGLTARQGGHLRWPLRSYVLLEVTIGLSGIAVVLALPLVNPLLVPFFRSVVDQPALLNLFRLGAALAVMLVPATAMGATLPLLVEALARRDVPFGHALGFLYGANTLGGVAGVVATETLLIPAAGVTGSALVAAALNLAAAAAAFQLVRRGRETAPEPPPPAENANVSRALLAAAFLCGALLLGLEIVWFRFLLLFLRGTTLAFALMLAVILAGIAAGGLLASFWLKRDGAADGWLPEVSLATGVAVVVTYAGFLPAAVGGEIATGLRLSSQLMLTGAFLSGLLFTLLGAAVRRRARGAVEAAGRLTLANTVGAMAGALLGGFALLPGLGIERALFTLAAGYGAVALLTFADARGRRPPRRRLTLGAAATFFLVTAALFPFGLLHNGHMKRAMARSGIGSSGERLITFREGLMETVSYFRTDWGGEPHDYRLVTNGHSMSGTSVYAQRYMKLYVYWALAVHPGAERALLLCYGVGNTAKALADSRGLRTIDVVDISRDVIALAHVPYPAPLVPPLDDPRMHVHVEDGRFFLQTTPRRFDLITAEPPPPKNAGVVNLYSREYFQLVYERLSEGGVATYWLPVDQLLVPESQAITRAFCSAFSDCTLWTAGGGNWMLAGTRGAHPPGREAFERQWRDPIVSAEMRRLALETPEVLGALFIADSGQLAEWTNGVEPLSDQWPRRVSHLLPPIVDAAYRRYADAETSRARFLSSAWVREHWPAELRERTAAYFAYRGIFDDHFFGQPPEANLESLYRVVSETRLSGLAVLLLGTDPVQVDIIRRAAARGVRHPMVDFVLGADALAHGDAPRARHHFEAALAIDPEFESALRYLPLAARLAEGRAGPSVLESKNR